MKTHSSIFDTGVLILRGAESEARFKGHIPKTYVASHEERAG